MKYSSIIGLILALVLTSCRFHETDWVTFSKPTSPSTMFCPTSFHYTEGIPDNCYMLDGTPIKEWLNNNGNELDTTKQQSRTTGTSATWVIQNLVEYAGQQTLVEIAGTYRSVDENGDSITLSGKVIMPANGNFKRYILTSHYTIGGDHEAPSNAFPLEALVTHQGYAMVMPDYIGYGITRDKVHPYLCMDVTAQNVVDMMVAVRRYFEAQNLRPTHSDVILMGFSQGGANTMAVERLIEMQYQNQEIRRMDPTLYISIHRVFAGGGPYDVKATYENFVNSNVAGYPVAVPLVLQGMIKGNHLNIKLSDLLQPRVAENIDEWINSKRYNSSQINSFINSHVTSDILNELGMDPTSYEVSELYRAMTANSIAAYHWTPKAPIYLLHSMDDDVVSYINATSAKSRWANANITYNFGHYGNHVICCLRFLSVVSNLLKEEDEQQ